MGRGVFDFEGDMSRAGNVSVGSALRIVRMPQRANGRMYSPLQSSGDKTAMRPLVKLIWTLVSIFANYCLPFGDQLLYRTYRRYMIPDCLCDRCASAVDKDYTYSSRTWITWLQSWRRNFRRTPSADHPKFDPVGRQSQHFLSSLFRCPSAFYRASAENSDEV